MRLRYTVANGRSGILKIAGKTIRGKEEKDIHLTPGQVKILTNTARVTVTEFEPPKASTITTTVTSEPRVNTAEIPLDTADTPDPTSTSRRKKRLKENT